MVKLWHDIPMGALFCAHPAGVVSVLSIQPTYEANNKYSISAPQGLEILSQKRHPALDEEDRMPKTSHYENLKHLAWLVTIQQ